MMKPQCPSISEILNTKVRQIGAECMRSISPKEVYDLALEMLGILVERVFNSETSSVRSYVLPYCRGEGLDIGAVGGLPSDQECGIKSDSIVIDLKPARKPSIQADARKLSMIKDQVDYIYSSHMLEDLKELELVPTLNEWFKHLKTNGYMIICGPVQSVYRRHCQITGQPLNLDHKIENYSLRYLKFKLSQTQFTYRVIKEISLLNNYSFLLVIQKL